MPKYLENLIHFCNPVLEHYELDDEMGRMFVRSMVMMLGTTRREDLFLFRGSRPHAPLDHRGARPETDEKPIFCPPQNCTLKT
eukprot:COSAG05_NODE_4822_length_1358_cov_40.370929_2_plen_83_part_00